MKTYRAAILGCRSRGSSAARVYRAHPRTEVVGLCDLLEDRLLLPGRPERSSTGEGGDCTVVETDVSRSDQVGAMIEAWLETYGRIALLHHNVGILEVGGPVEASEESWDRVCQSPMKGMTCKVVCRA